jgi:two-component system cell cycle sensor histidine kinase/response regulator CckA
VVTLRTGETCTDVVVGIHAADGAFRWCSVNCRAWRASEGAAAHGVVASFSDITALRDLGGRLLEAQQLETVARLAGGIAHEFNNLLTVVLGCSELGLAQVEAHSKLAGYLTRIQESGDRAALLSGHLLALARRRPPVETRVDLGEWCASNLCVLRALLGPGVQVALERERTLWPVLADRMQLQQVLLTVASHAADAMTVGGHVKIRLANATLGPGADSPAGEYVEWSVADDGVGMAPELLAHLFEPSFGTKAVGEGRELGLASCHGIVRRLGGRLAVRSAPANGSTVTIHLPRARPIEAP